MRKISKLIFVLMLSVLAVSGFSLRNCFGFDVVQVTNTPDIDEKDYSIAIFGTTVYAIWKDVNTAQLYFDKSTDMGDTWGLNTKVIATSGGYNEQYNNPSNKILVDKAGNLFILYQNESRLFFMKSTDGGENFTYSGDISLPLSNYIFDFAVDEAGDTVYIVSVAGGIYMCKSTDGGSSFSPAKKIFTDIATNEIKLETNKAGNELYVFFVNNRQVPNIGDPPLVWRTRVDFSRSLDGGETFNPIKSVLTGEWPGLDASYCHWGKNIDAAIDGNGRLYVSWAIQANWNIAPFVVLSESPDKGKTFTHTAITSSDFNGGLISGHLAIDWDRTSLGIDEAGDACITFIQGIYTKGALTGYSIYYKQRLAGSKFKAATPVAGPLYFENLPINLLPPTTQMTPNGHIALMLWRNNIPEVNNHDLYSRKFFNNNKAPVLGHIGNKTVNEDETLDFTLTATDPDGDPLIYAIKNLPKGANFDTKTGQFTWTPGYDQDKKYQGIKFTVTDGVLTDSEIITMKVNNVNRPPTIEPIGNKSVAAGTLLQFTVKGSDPDTVTDKQKLAYSVINRPTGATINSTTGVFKWKPTAKQVREQPYVVTFVVSDGKLSASDTIEIKVLKN